MIILIYISLLGLAYAAPPSSVRIVGGAPTTIQAYPYMIDMQFYYNNNIWFHSCGGSLVTTKTILSAAHCYFESDSSQWRSRVGTSYVSSEGRVYLVSEIVRHPSFNLYTVDNDVAIVRLQLNVEPSDSVKVIPIAAPNYNPPDGTTVTAVGWGNLEFEGESPEQLQHVDVHVINQKLCADRYAYLQTLPGYETFPNVIDSMLCAGILDIGGKSVCHGDSGGPLVVTDDPTVGHVLVGITSWGFGCADAGYPAVYARVSYNSNWIVANGSH